MQVTGMPSSAPSTLTIPAGKRVTMVLKSPLHTKSGTAGSGNLGLLKVYS
jgi:hypothetical protein